MRCSIKGFKRVVGTYDKRKVFYQKGRSYYKCKNGKMIFSHTLLE